MLDPLWQVSETYVSYNDVVDKWGAASALHAAMLSNNGKQGLDLASAAIALNIVFPDKKVAEIIKDLSKAQQSALDKASACKEKVK